MKKQIIILLFLLTFLFSACTPAPGSTVHTVTFNGQTYTVDTQNRTIIHEEDVYHVLVDPGAASKTTKILYPNGATYYRTQTNGMEHEGQSNDYDPQRYVDGETLLTVLTLGVKPTTTTPTMTPLWGILLIMLGLIETVFPQLGWYLRYGWAFKNGEPSDLAMGLSRAGGVLILIIGIIALFV